MISAIDGREYNRANGSFTRHLKSLGLTYQAYHETHVTGIAVTCECGAPAKFYQRNHTYAATCGAKACAGKLISNQYQSKTDTERAAISQKKSSAWQTKSAQDVASILAKRQATTMERHGVSHHMQLPEVKDKISQTVTQRYGHAHHTQSYDFQSQQRMRHMDKTGVAHHMQLPEVSQKVSESHKQRCYGDARSLLTTDQVGTTYASGGISAVYQQLGVTKNTAYRILKSFDIATIKPKYSLFETEVYDYIKSVYGGEVIRSDRTVLMTHEIDIYCPEIGVAIECNGVYWHSEGRGRDCDYHLTKTTVAREKGVRLIHIFDCEWYQSTDAVKAIIDKALGVAPTIAPTDVRSITCDCADEFMSVWHVGPQLATVQAIGAYHGDDLVVVMSIDAHGDCYYASTAVTVDIHHIVGHWHLPISVTCDLSKFTGTTWQSLGFGLITAVGPTRKYTDNSLVVWDCGHATYFRNKHAIISSADGSVI